MNLLTPITKLILIFMSVRYVTTYLIIDDFFAVYVKANLAFWVRPYWGSYSYTPCCTCGERMHLIVEIQGTSCVLTAEFEPQLYIGLVSNGTWSIVTRGCTMQDACAHMHATECSDILMMPALFWLQKLVLVLIPWWNSLMMNRHRLNWHLGKPVLSAQHTIHLHSSDQKIF